uniref:Protein kinase domain-containing protein n=1 Tax=Ciona savignyi TaxID=51511 RepID=H2YJ57_CIOSA
RIDDGDNHSIVINNITADRAGVYSCVASSEGGHVTCKAELLVKLACNWSDSSSDDSQQISNQRIRDTYRFVGVIGRGAFSVIKRAIQISTGQEVAAKFVQRKHRNDKLAQNEIEFLTKVQHPHIVKFHESFTTSSHVIIVTEILSIELFEFFV